LSPDDAPVLVVSSRSGGSAGANGDTTQSSSDPAASTSKQLQDYQRRLQGLLDNLTQGNALPAGLGGSTTESTPSPDIGSSLRSAAAGLFGGELQGSATPRVKATTLGDRSLTLPKGTAFTCALKTRVISATSGLVGCQVQRDVYSDNGRVLLIERGSHLDGEYRIASVRPGTVRIPVLWTRIRTPNGVTVDVESPGTGQLGESGIDGHVDNRWGDRIGAAMLLSLIDDSVKLVIQNQMQDRDADTIVLPSTTENTSKLAEKVLDSTINIPPLIYQNQGGIVGIYVARDVDFSSVYALQPVAR
jgi:type IV secretion system protein VirB10